MNIRRFSEFQPTIETFTKRVGLVKEQNIIPELFGDRTADVVIKIPDNNFSTYQVFNRFPGSNFIPRYVSNKMKAMELGSPITVVSPLSEIKTYSTKRAVRLESQQSGSLYFRKPKITDQYQVAVHEGRIIGVRKIIEGKPVHLRLNRFPKLTAIQNIANSLYESLKSEVLRFRLGQTESGFKLLAMENFTLQKPELVDLYFVIHENFVGPVPEWFKHHIESSIVIPYLSEYINRDSVKQKCPYVL